MTYLCTTVSPTDISYEDMLSILLESERTAAVTLEIKIFYIIFKYDEDCIKTWQASFPPPSTAAQSSKGLYSVTPSALKPGQTFTGRTITSTSCGTLGSGIGGEPDPSQSSVYPQPATVASWLSKLSRSEVFAMQAGV